MKVLLIELSQKKTLWILESLQKKNKKCFNKSILHKYSSQVFFKF